MRRSRILLSLMLAATMTACVDDDPLGPATRGPQYSADIPAAWNGNMRIGVVPSATSITIGSAGDFTIRAKTSGAVLMTGSNSEVTVTMSTPSVVKWYVQVACASPAGVDALVALANSFGHPYTLEPIAACTRVLLGDFLLSQPFSDRNAFRLLLISQGFPSDAFGVSRTVSVATYKLSDGTTEVNTTQPPVLTSSTGLVTINGVTYRNAAEVRGNASGTLAGINELPVEQYLYGVVPRELGPTIFPEVEAQKAQAVAARTYALAGIGKRAADGYDLLATTSDQVYGGYAAEHPVSTAAVDATRGVALTYNGALISALYSSASGGHTADSEEAFDGAPAPYLRGIPDSEHGQAFDHVPTLAVFMANSNPQSLRGAREGDFESNWSSRHRWTFAWTQSEINAVISAWHGSDVGNVNAINVLERGPSGRVLRIEYVTDAGTFTDTKDHIRSSLRFIGANGAFSNLPSTLLFVEADRKNGGFVVYGGGFGHGVGMSQTGAEGMAEKGHSFDEILRHYYQGVELTTKY